MGRSFDIVVHGIIDIGWPLRGVVDKPIVASSTCYGFQQDAGKHWPHARDKTRGTSPGGIAPLRSHLRPLSARTG